MNVTATTQASPPALASAGKEPARGSEPAGKPLPVSGSSPPPERHAQPPVSIDRALEQIKAYLSESKRQLTFERDESTGRSIIKVIDPASGDIIRQFPSEEVLKVAAIIEAQGFHTVNELA